MERRGVCGLIFRNNQLHIMKLLKAFLPFFLLIAVLTIIAACSAKKSGTDDKDQIYTCSMHPQVRHKGPGNCPICGMTLTPLVTIQPSATKEPVAPEPSTTSSASPSVPTPIDAPLAAPGTAEVVVDAARSSVSSVKIEAATPRRLVRTIQIFGEIQYIFDKHLDFTWYYGGRIEKVLFDYNTTELKKGEPLFEVYSESFIADQEAYLTALRERYLSTFYERDVLSAKIEAAADRLRQAGFSEQDLKDLVNKKKVQRTFIIRAPITGSIVGDIMHTGERFTPESVILHITDLSQVWFTADIFEQDLSSLRLGELVHLTSKARPGATFTGKLVFIDRRVNAEKRTVRARFVISNPKHDLLPQLSATGTLEITLGEVAVTVPSSAVIDTGRRKLVYVQTGADRYQPKDVETGGEGQASGSDQLFTAITSGLKVGDKVVTGGAFLIDAEAQLQGGASSSSAPTPIGEPLPIPPSTPLPSHSGHQH